MGLRPGKCYKEVHRPYTRQSQRKPRKSYIKGIPRHVISNFEGGKKGTYEYVLYLVSKETAQIRHNAIESGRVAAVQRIEKHIPKGSSFFFRVRLYPHHVLRENAMATGAGADRFQTGMRQSFGKPISTAAQVRVGQKLFELHVNKNTIQVAKDSFKAASYKLPVRCRVVIEETAKA